MLYLDNAATTPVHPEALEAMMPFLTSEFGNPSSHHSVGERAAAALADARASVARVLGMRKGDVVFTSGGTEANNLAIKGIAIAAQLRRDAAHIITTPIEHESVLQSVRYLQRVHGFVVTELPVDRDGRVDPADLDDALCDLTALVTIGYANNEVGTVQDVAALAAVAAAHRVPIHIDAVQAAGWLDLSAAELGVDAVSIAGHKVGAPKGTGAVGVRGRIPLEPLLHGGGQERGRRSGTENVAGAVALARALEIADAARDEASARVSAARDQLIRHVLDTVPGAALTGHPTERLPGTASFTFAGTGGEAVLLELERRGFVSSSGSACAAGSDEASHVLIALGIAPEVAQTAVRITLPHTFTGDARPIAEAVTESVAALRPR
ncbi:cysteine desulfurase [Microbacterium sp. LRZ72]|uniref:cysteine desulfurase family protein n=1 Tax=Microbacterium sp. LRZ72 TaxID=2942481 RepID=UPI0029A45554|nr:cysteine desulfurase family protein [Microbacterium sp. LRZ72]MDX2375775.1 cysteine desulfurase [Microbacterium sp. LRZ72]